MLTIPDAEPLPLPAPFSLLWALLLLTFFLHVLAMNFVLGGSILLLFTRGTALADAFRKAMPTVLAAAISLGVAPLLFLQTLYGRLFFPSAVLMGWFWLAIVPIVMLAYYGTYANVFRGTRVWITAAVAMLLIAVAFVQTNNMTLMLRPDQFLPMYRSSATGLHLNLTDPTFIPRYLHMLLGAIAVAGLVAYLWGKRRKDEWAQRIGTRWFTVATLLNVVIGLWWLFALPRPVLMRASVWVGLGVAAMVIALARRSAPALLLTIASMVMARDEVRRGMLDLAGFRHIANASPQWDVFAIFAVLLVAALATTAWMASLLLRTRST